jgi:hypothetical protein
LKFFLLVSSNNFLCHDTRFDKPLSWDDWLYPTFATRTESNLVSIWFDFDEISLTFEKLYDILTGFFSWFESCEYPTFCCHKTIFVYDFIACFDEFGHLLFSLLQIILQKDIQIFFDDLPEWFRSKH